VATAGTIGAACKVDVERIDGLNDLDYRACQGTSNEDVRATLVDAYDDWIMRPHLVLFPSGESLQDLVAWTADVLRYVIANHRDAASTIVLVGHDSVNRAILPKKARPTGLTHAHMHARVTLFAYIEAEAEQSRAQAAPTGSTA
jgi:phosphoserine phosphatase